MGSLFISRAKRFYTKMAYTTKYDWRIRDLLDEAEDYIANDAKVAIEKLTAILEKYPDSPRGKYDLARALQFKFDETDPISEEEKLKRSQDLIQRFVDIMKMFKPLDDTTTEDEDEENAENESRYVLPPGILHSAYLQAIQECDARNLTEQSAEITEKLFELNPNYLKTERFQVIQIERYYSIDDVQNFERSVERARVNFPGSMMIKFFYGLMLKRTGRKKEGAKLLKEVEYEGESALQFAEEISQVGRGLYNRGRIAQAHELFRETSKTHGYLSTFQRPVFSNPDLVKPVFSVTTLFRDFAIFADIKLDT